MSEAEFLNNIKRLIKQKYIDTDDDIIGILKKILNYIDKQQKVINLMAESWKQDDIRSVEQIKEYFYKKVEKENE